jgi:hypothetical protein
MPMGLRSGGAICRGDHLLPTELSVLVSPIAVSLARGRIVGAVTTTEVAGSLGFPIEVGLNDLLASGVLGGDIQELPHRARGLTAERVQVMPQM